MGNWPKLPFAVPPVIPIGFVSFNSSRSSISFALRNTFLGVALRAESGDCW